MQGRELDRPVHTWFGDMLPTTEPPDRVARALAVPESRGQRLVWLGGEALEVDGCVQLHTVDGQARVPCGEAEAAWLTEVLDAAHPAQEALDMRDAIEGFPGDWEAFADRWSVLRQLGLVAV